MLYYITIALLLGEISAQQLNVNAPYFEIDFTNPSSLAVPTLDMIDFIQYVNIDPAKPATVSVDTSSVDHLTLVSGQDLQMDTTDVMVPIQILVGGLLSDTWTGHYPANVDIPFVVVDTERLNIQRNLKYFQNVDTDTHTITFDQYKFQFNKEVGSDKFVCVADVSQTCIEVNVLTGCESTPYDDPSTRFSFDSDRSLIIKKNTPFTETIKLKTTCLNNLLLREFEFQIEVLAQDDSTHQALVDSADTSFLDKNTIFEVKVTQYEDTEIFFVQEIASFEERPFQADDRLYFYTTCFQQFKESMTWVPTDDYVGYGYFYSPDLNKIDLPAGTHSARVNYNVDYYSILIKNAIKTGVQFYGLVEKSIQPKLTSDSVQAYYNNPFSFIRCSEFVLNETKGTVQGYDDINQNWFDPDGVIYWYYDISFQNDFNSWYFANFWQQIYDGNVLCSTVDNTEYIFTQDAIYDDRQQAWSVWDTNRIDMVRLHTNNFELFDDDKPDGREFYLNTVLTSLLDGTEYSHTVKVVYKWCVQDEVDLKLYRDGVEVSGFTQFIVQVHSRCCSSINHDQNSGASQGYQLRTNSDRCSNPIAYDPDEILNFDGHKRVVRAQGSSYRHFIHWNPEENDRHVQMNLGYRVNSGLGDLIIFPFDGYQCGEEKVVMKYYGAIATSIDGKWEEYTIPVYAGQNSGIDPNIYNLEYSQMHEIQFDQTEISKIEDIVGDIDKALELCDLASSQGCYWDEYSYEILVAGDQCDINEWLIHPDTGLGYWTGRRINLDPIIGPLLTYTSTHIEVDTSEEHVNDRIFMRFTTHGKASRFYILTIVVCKDPSDYSQIQVVDEELQLLSFGDESTIMIPSYEVETYFQQLDMGGDYEVCVPADQNQFEYKVEQIPEEQVTAYRFGQTVFIYNNALYVSSAPVTDEFPSVLSFTLTVYNAIGNTAEKLFAVNFEEQVYQRQQETIIALQESGELPGPNTAPEFQTSNPDLQSVFHLIVKRNQETGLPLESQPTEVIFNQDNPSYDLEDDDYDMIFDNYETLQCFVSFEEVFGSKGRSFNIILNTDKITVDDIGIHYFTVSLLQYKENSEIIDKGTIYEFTIIISIQVEEGPYKILTQEELDCSQEENEAKDNAQDDTETNNEEIQTEDSSTSSEINNDAQANEASTIYGAINQEALSNDLEEQTQEELEDEEIEEEIEDFDLVPFLEIGNIGPMGAIDIYFNTDMFIHSIVDQEESFDWSSVLSIKLISGLDDSLIEGTFIQDFEIDDVENEQINQTENEISNTNRRLNETTDNIQGLPQIDANSLTDNYLCPEEYKENEECELYQKQFSWYNSIFNDEQMQFQLEFERPIMVSTSTFGSDKLVIEFKNVTQFSSIDTEYSPFLYSSISTCETTENSICSAMPPQILDEVVVETIVESTDNFFTGLTLITSGNMISLVFVGGAAQSLFSLIRQLQLLLFSAALEITFPAHVNFLYTIIIQFAELDIFQGEKIFENVVIKYTPPFSETFDEFGMGNMNVINNSGSMLIIVGIVILTYAAMKIILKLAKKFFKFRIARKIGIIAQENALLKLPLEKFLIESYLDILLAIGLNFVAMLYCYEIEDYLEWWSTFNNFFCTILTYTLIIITLYIPYHIKKKIQKNFRKLNQHQIRSELGIYYEEYRYYNFYSANYTVYTLLRRLGFVILLIFMSSHTIYQSIHLLILSTMNLCFLIDNKPYNTKTMQRQEIVNEISIMISTYLHMSFLLEYDDDYVLVEQKEKLGWILVANIGCNLMFNLILAGIQMVKDLIASIYDAGIYIKDYFNMRSKKQIRDFMEAKQIYVNNDISYILKKQDEAEAIQFCKSFNKERIWCMQNKLDYRDLPEEEKFQEYMQKYQFKQKRQIVMQNIKNRISIFEQRQKYIMKAKKSKYLEQLSRTLETYKETKQRKKYQIATRIYYNELNKNQKEEEKQIEERSPDQFMIIETKRINKLKHLTKMDLGQVKNIINKKNSLKIIDEANNESGTEGNKDDDTHIICDFTNIMIKTREEKDELKKEQKEEFNSNINQLADIEKFDLANIKQQKKEITKLQIMEKRIIKGLKKPLKIKKSKKQQDNIDEDSSIEEDRKEKDEMLEDERKMMLQMTNKGIQLYIQDTEDQISSLSKLNKYDQKNQITEKYINKQHDIEKLKDELFPPQLKEMKDNLEFAVDYLPIKEKVETSEESEELVPIIKQVDEKQEAREIKEIINQIEIIQGKKPKKKKKKIIPKTLIEKYDPLGIVSWGKWKKNDQYNKRNNEPESLSYVYATLQCMFEINNLKTTLVNRNWNNYEPLGKDTLLILYSNLYDEIFPRNNTTAQNIKQIEWLFKSLKDKIFQISDNHTKQPKLASFLVSQIINFHLESKFKGMTKINMNEQTLMNQNIQQSLSAYMINNIGQSMISQNMLNLHQVESKCLNCLKESTHYEEHLLVINLQVNLSEKLKKVDVQNLLDVKYGYEDHEFPIGRRSIKYCTKCETYVKHILNFRWLLAPNLLIIRPFEMNISTVYQAFDSAIKSNKNNKKLLQQYDEDKEVFQFEKDENLQLDEEVESIIKNEQHYQPTNIYQQGLPDNYDQQQNKLNNNNEQQQQPTVPISEMSNNNTLGGFKINSLIDVSPYRINEDRRIQINQLIKQQLDDPNKSLQISNDSQYHLFGMITQEEKSSNSSKKKAQSSNSTAYKTYVKKEYLYQQYLEDDETTRVRKWHCFTENGKCKECQEDEVIQQKKPVYLFYQKENE